MAVYWLTFRLEHDVSYGDRYDALVSSVKVMTTGKWWYEPSSFFLFESNKNIDDVASGISDAIDGSKDLALIGMTDYKSARLVGISSDDDLFDLMPFTKYA